MTNKKMWNLKKRKMKKVINCSFCNCNLFELEENIRYNIDLSLFRIYAFMWNQPNWECRKLRSRLLLISMCLISSNGAQNLLYDCRRRQIAHFIRCRSTFRIPTKLCSTKFVQSNRNVDDSLECWTYQHLLLVNDTTHELSNAFPLRFVYWNATAAAECLHSKLHRLRSLL